MAVKKTHNEFLDDVKKVHGDKYEYPENYVNAKTKIKIICKIHGGFFQTPKDHLKGKGCPMCGRNIKKTHNEFLDDVKKVHGDKYEYPENYVNAKTKIKIICKIHGEFYQTPDNHINKEKGCPKCGNIDRKNTKLIYKDKEEVLKKFKIIHNNEYEYPKFAFTKANDLIDIICPKHGHFQKSVFFHLKGKGCPKCVNRVRKTNEEFINEANKMHLNYYTYDNFNYINNRTKSIITCSKHGDFFQTPKDHLNGNGCPKCRLSKGEKKIMEILENHKINYISQHKIKTYKYDFYILNKNVLIEYHGEQHYVPIKYMGGEEKFKKIKIRDNNKIEIAKKMNIELLIISYTNYNNLEKILKENNII
ncbi:MAG: hypothetical protein ACOC33_02280 [bacterium]